MLDRWVGRNGQAPGTAGWAFAHGVGTVRLPYSVLPISITNHQQHWKEVPAMPVFEWQGATSRIRTGDSSFTDGRRGLDRCTCFHTTC